MGLLSEDPCQFQLVCPPRGWFSKSAAISCVQTVQTALGTSDKRRSFMRRVSCWRAYPRLETTPRRTHLAEARYGWLSTSIVTGALGMEFACSQNA
jgi:hypothetical protein